MASLYIEAGAGLGSFSSGQAFFGQSTASSGSGFLGSLSAYIPVTSEKNFAHLELGIQNRFLSASDSSGATLDFATSELAARLEISRLYFGGGYTPFTFVNSQGSGILSIHRNSKASAYFVEAGAIWRVIPELQICAEYSLERGLISGGGTSPSLVSEYALRFRFPFAPDEHQGGKNVKFDGFRYPFGVMK